GQAYGGILPELVLRRLMVTGSLDYPEGEGALTLKVKQLAAALRGLPLGGVVVDVGAIRVDSIEPIKIVFDGLRPRAISLTLNGLALERVTVTRAPAAAVEDELDEDVEAAADLDSEVDDSASASAQQAPAGVSVGGDVGDGAPADADDQ
ncbi:MAG TPA: hypothetical protein VNM90_16135, partial [Haliangium sp.]|nr:hypothetical protein [Haliangium sp.]